MDVNGLKRQHQEIMKQVGEIEDVLTVEKVLAQAFEVSLKIGYLSGIIKIHLKTEDDYLYPSLAKSQDKQVVERAASFSREMGGIAGAFGKFRDDYNSANKIKENPRQFVLRSQEIFSEIRKRMEKEEKLLYPLVAK